MTEASMFGVPCDTPWGRRLFRAYTESRGDYSSVYREYRKIKDEEQAAMATRPDMRVDVESWDIQVHRQWPYFTTARTPYETIVPPIEVQISVKFLTDASARTFEARVRELLEGPGVD